MTLSVIGAGMGRTGTDSLKRALEILGFGPCYHMFEVLKDQDRVNQWIDIAHGAAPDWDDVFKGFGATVDWPAAHYWQALAAHYPQAKVILSIRDAEGWLKSMENTILPILRKRTYRQAMGDQLLVPIVFQGNVEDASHIRGLYEKHNDAVKQAIAADRLLVYEVGSGWEPLCTFLEVAIPDVPYPHGNTSAQFGDNLSKAHATRLDGSA